jgi:AraC-like DNA-binding protein
MMPIQQEELVRLLSQYSNAEGLGTTAINGLSIFKSYTPTANFPAAYNPALCLVVQGSKALLIENERLHYVGGEFLVVSVDMPVIGTVVDASPEAPYLCMALDIVPDQLSSLVSEMADIDMQIAADSRSQRGLFVGTADQVLTDALLRLARLLDTPQDIALLAPLLIKEIYYRLLQGPYGASIAQCAISGSHMQRIAQVIHQIKADLSLPLRIPMLAELAHMSASSFHAHFKQVTAMSPLQYQKRLRLLEARRLLLTERSDAAHAAYHVGYESPSQFSREYSRMFGSTPRSDMANVKSQQSLQMI